MGLWHERARVGRNPVGISVGGGVGCCAAVNGENYTREHGNDGKVERG